MAELSEQQHEILTDMRHRGLDSEASKLQGLYEQLVIRPNSEQLIELTSQMVRQYIGPGNPPAKDACDVVGGIKFPDGGSDTEFVPAPDPSEAETYGVSFAVNTGLGRATPPEEKVRIELVDFDFIIAMAKIAMSGLGDSYDPPRKPGDWKKYNAEELEERRGSLLRHYAAGEWASVALNAMILWWHERNAK